MHELRSTILSGEPKAALVARKGKAKAESSADAGGLARIAIKRQEARVTNQRLEDRLLGIVESTTMIFRRRRQDVAVVNVSSRGAMIRSGIEPRIGEKIDLLFDGRNKTRCLVRWIRDGRIGLEFAEETILWTADPKGGPVFQADRPEPAPIHMVTDREPRQKLLRAGTLYWSGISIPVRLRNISGGGARVESGRELCPGSEVELDLGEAGFQIAEVRWSKDGQVGLRFAESFDIESLAPSPKAERPPEVLKPAYLETELQPDSPWAARFEKLSLTDLKPAG